MMDISKIYLDSAAGNEESAINWRNITANALANGDIHSASFAFDCANRCEIWAAQDRLRAKQFSGTPTHHQS